MSDVKWIKITTDIFDDEKILLIESLPEADAIIVIWFKLLCLAGKQNNCGVFVMANGMPYTDKMLAAIFRKKESTIQLALTTFEQFGMIEIIDGTVTIPNWGKHQNLEQIQARREYKREWQREYRLKQKEIAQIEGVDSCGHPRGQHVHSLERELEGEEDFRKEKIYKREKTKEVAKEVIEYLNSKCNTKYRANSESTLSHISARLSEGYTLEDFKTVIDKQYKKWHGTEYEIYLRPDTLFRPQKFDVYLNAPDVETRKVAESGIAYTDDDGDLDGII